MHMPTMNHVLATLFALIALLTLITTLAQQLLMSHGVVHPLSSLTTNALPHSR
jgi:uncharacterized membrane protein